MSNIIYEDKKAYIENNQADQEPDGRKDNGNTSRVYLVAPPSESKGSDNKQGTIWHHKQVRVEGTITEALYNGWRVCADRRGVFKP